MALPLLDVLVVDAEDDSVCEWDFLAAVVTMTGGGVMLEAAAE